MGDPEMVESARRPVRMKAVALTVGLLLALAGCSSDSPTSSESVATSSVPVPDETTTLPRPPTSDSATTTTSTPPQSDPTTTVPTTPPSAVWTDADAYPSGYGAGCCGANATGTPSPELTASPAPLADGTYAMNVVAWSPDDPTQLQVSVRSLVACADGVVDCYPLEDGTYGPDEVGYSQESRTIDVTLDDSVLVYLAGDDADSESETQSILRSTSGIGLADLMTAIAAAYETAIATPLRAGTSVDDIVADLQANPRLGFTSAAEQMTGLLYFSAGDAPPVLFQVVADQGQALERSGTTELIPRTFAIENGAITLEFYAGFRS